MKADGTFLQYMRMSWHPFPLVSFCTLSLESTYPQLFHRALALPLLFLVESYWPTTQVLEVCSLSKLKPCTAWMPQPDLRLHTSSSIDLHNHISSSLIPVKKKLGIVWNILISNGQTHCLTHKNTRYGEYETAGLWLHNCQSNCWIVPFVIYNVTSRCTLLGNLSKFPSSPNILKFDF